MITLKVFGNFKNSDRFLKKMSTTDFANSLKSVGQKGVDALSAATPMDSGLTASSWGYELERTKTTFTFTWTNSNVVSGFPVAVMLQYGHGTGTGGYVQGRDYINPSMAPIFEQIINDLWMEVISA